jgi:hypothetical protein
MIRRLLLVSALCLLSGALISADQVQTPAPRSANQDRLVWVADSLKRMQTIKVGMTRAESLRVFTIEGGISNRLGRTYVSLDCPYFKVDVEFRPVGPPPDTDCCSEGPDDVIVKISRPYLGFTVMD